ncbi:pilus assembly protein PilP [Aromatoleum toluvorans]|uniref:Pilus assembly protein PilP n=1 Tax=Aromatoleum toluvorans TaxID=92002 RepID=A0ABX1PY19_9RHOO|nr:pilus assembly protein PilP [Aromatoleum toluvorans]NMG43134.1 pilus assembly protein PilP [Aromatoleum toluvorans]
MKRLLILASALVLTACSSDQEDIQGWMAEQEKGMTGTIKPLPEMKPAPVVKYEAEGASDPFLQGRIEPETKTSRRGGPDLDRRREPLEAFPLESLQLVGVIKQNRKVHALVKADQNLHQVRVGNYMGQNFGLVTAITESEVTLKELVEDMNGDWVERISTLLLQEQQEARK